MNVTNTHKQNGAYTYYTMHSMHIQRFSDIDHGFYINLERRIDRKMEVETELEKMGLKGKVARFNAVSTKNGSIGCTMSHIKCLEAARDNQYPHVLIVEDDIQFLDPDTFTSSFDAVLQTVSSTWDVILLAGNNLPPHIQLNEHCVKVTQCQTTTGYLVNGHYFDTLIAHMREGLKLLMRNPEQHVQYAVDKHWFGLQRIHKWFLVTPLTVVQRAGYSDIEGRRTDYKRAMVDLEKTEFLRRVQNRRMMRP